MERRVADSAEVVIGATRPIAEDFSRRLGARAFHVPNGWDPALDVGVAAAAPPALSGDVVNLVHTGQLSGPRGRDPRPLFEAMRRLVEERGDARRLRLVLVGGLDAAEERMLARARRARPRRADRAAAAPARRRHPARRRRAAPADLAGPRLAGHREALRVPRRRPADPRARRRERGGAHRRARPAPGSWSAPDDVAAHRRRARPVARRARWATAPAIRPSSPATSIPRPRRSRRGARRGRDRAARERLG